MVELNLHFVDELIQVRQAQHGGGRGAPPIAGGHRVGASINRSCIVMLSALLQSYIEEVFEISAKRAFPPFRRDENAWDKYWKQLNRWGNPSDSNIITLFMKLGVVDVFDGLTWQANNTAAIKLKLNRLNQLRNQIAHGDGSLRLNGQPYSLSLAEVSGFRNFAAAFGERFQSHAVTAVRRARLGLL